MKEKINAFSMKAKEKVNQLMRSMTALAAAGAFFVGTAYADGPLMGSALFTGVKNLFTDLGTAMVILCPFVGTAFAAYYIARRNAADTQDAKMWEQRAKNAIFGGVAGSLVSGVITLLAAYF